MSAAFVQTGAELRYLPESSQQIEALASPASNIKM
jgi:hypothetical protein